LTEPATPALRERRRNQTLREIGDAALRLFDAQGYKQTTIDDVAHAAGVSPRTVFRYFPTKADLIFDWFPDLEAFIKALSLEATTPAASLRELERIVQGALDGFETMDASTAQQYAVFRRMVSRDPDLSAALADWEQRLVKLAQSSRTNASRSVSGARTPTWPSAWCCRPSSAPSRSPWSCGRRRRMRACPRFTRRPGRPGTRS